MSLAEAKRIYAHPNGHTKTKLYECLDVLNAQPHELSFFAELAITNAKHRLDTLDGVIEGEFRVIEEPPQLDE